MPVRRLSIGRWELAARAEEVLFGFFVLDGALSRETEILGRRVVELLGPGDLLRPTEGTGWASVPYEPAWRVMAPSRIAVLGEDFERRLAEMPGVAGQLAGRGIQRSRVLAMQFGIAGIRPLSARLLAALWQLSDRWGRREGGVTVLELPLRHELLASLVGATRPKVSARLKELSERGLISRRPDRLWALHGRAPTTLEHLEALCAPELTSPDAAGRRVKRVRRGTAKASK